MGRLIGYARVSTDDQTLELQLDALQDAGCLLIFEDVTSGSKSLRPGLEHLLAELTAGDTLLVWRLDRLGRSLRHLVDLISELSSRDIEFRSLGDGAIDTTTASGELIFHIFAALAQFERNLIRERTHAGLAAARSRGRVGGRRPIGPKNPKVIAAKKMHADKTLSVSAICESLSISRPTLYRYLKIT